MRREVDPNDGKAWCLLENDSPAGTVVYKDTIVLTVPPNRKVPEIYPSPESVILAFDNLEDDDSRIAIAALENPPRDVYTTFMRNSLKFPALVGYASIVPTLGIPFEHSCTPNAICAINSEDKNIFEVRLTRPVKRDERITLCYCPMDASAIVRRHYMSYYYGIVHQGCHVCEPKLSEGNLGKERLAFFRMLNKLKENVHWVGEGEGWDEIEEEGKVVEVNMKNLGEERFMAEFHAIHKKGKDLGLEPYLWDVLSEAEQLARQARFWEARIDIAYLLAALIKAQAGQNSAYKRAFRFREDVHDLEDWNEIGVEPVSSSSSSSSSDSD